VPYTYVISAVDNEGNRSPASVVTVLTDSNSRPSAPENIRHEIYSDTAAEIFWDRATDNDIVTGYEVIRNGESLGVRDSLGIFEGNLDPNLVYTYQVTSIDNQGNRSDTVTISLASGRSNRPSIPNNLRRELYSDSAAEIFWSRSEDNDAVIGYEVIRNGDNLGIHDALSLFQEALDPSITYNFKVTAIDNEGFRSKSTTISFKTSDREPVVEDKPEAVSGLRATVYSSTSAELFWQWPSIPVRWFEIKRNGEFLGLTNSISFFDDSLQQNTTYHYEVTIIDTSGRRSDPASVTITTPWGS